MAICVSEAYSVSERPIIYLAIKQSALYIIFFLGAGGGIVHFALKQNLACTEVWHPLRQTCSPIPRMQPVLLCHQALRRRAHPTVICIQ